MNDDDEETPREEPQEIFDLTAPKMNGVSMRFERFANGHVVVHYWKGKRGFDQTRTKYLLGIIEDPMEQVRLASFLVRP